MDGGTADAGRAGTGGGGATDRDGRATASTLEGAGGGAGITGAFAALAAGAGFAGRLGDGLVAARVPFARAADFGFVAGVEVRLAGGAGERRAEEGIFSFLRRSAIASSRARRWMQGTATPFRRSLGNPRRTRAAPVPLGRKPVNLSDRSSPGFPSEGPGLWRSATLPATLAASREFPRK
jgi:hypothetical protein